MLPTFSKNRLTWNYANIFIVLLLVSFVLLTWKTHSSKLEIVVTTENENSIDQVEQMKWKIDLTQTEEKVVFMETQQHQKVVIGAISCGNNSQTDSGYNSSITLSHRDANLIMIKSLVISAKLYKISAIDLHLFLEHPEDNQYFVGQLKEMGYPFDDVDLELFVYSVEDIVPELCRPKMVYNEGYRCGYVRFFLPSALPHVESIIYLDSDVIVSGDIGKIWNVLDQFEENQFIGAARAFEAHDTYYLDLHSKLFGDIPQPPPKGADTGLLVMNLAKMREYGWEQKFIQTYNDYSLKVKLSASRTFNIFLSSNSEIFKMLSCEYNFGHRHCDKGLTCTEAAEKNGRIYAVHGHGFKGMEEETFAQLLKSYQKFDLISLPNVNEQNNHQELVSFLRSNLMSPLRTAYGSLTKYQKCNKALKYLIYRDFFSDYFSVYDFV